MPASIKICGLTDAASVQAAAQAGAAYAGFVHFPASPRHVALEKAAALQALLPAAMRSVCVLVDPDDTLLEQVASRLSPHYIQLHGDEPPERLRAIRERFPKTGIIKALKVRASDDVAQAMRYTAHADMLLFDAKPPQLAGMLPGGNGLAFDWALLANREFPLPWLLSGGLNAENVGAALRQTGARMVDVSSGVESSPGVKDAALIHAFALSVKAA